MNNNHIPVMIDPVLELLDIRPGCSYADLTAGDGGHTEAIAKRLKGGKLIACDRDAEALERARTNLSSLGDSITFFHENFKNLSRILAMAKLDSLDGILVDLGISRYQLTTPDRGFSIMNEGPLDMRMDRSSGESAADLVNRLPATELENILRSLGEERFAKRIAAAIIERRRRKKITTTSELAALVAEAKPNIPSHRRKIHPATQTFQALRIAVNKELDSLGQFCSEAIDRLNPGGRVLFITFHSLEDRIIKKQFQLEAGKCICFQPPELCKCPRLKKIQILTKKPIIPDKDEIRSNPASRSAKLRAAMRIEAFRNKGGAE